MESAFIEVGTSPASMDTLLPIVYAELKRIAARELRGERPGHTLGATALVHEAWVELSKLNRLKPQNAATSWPSPRRPCGASSSIMR